MVTLGLLVVDEVPELWSEVAQLAEVRACRVAMLPPVAGHDQRLILEHPLHCLGAEPGDITDIPKPELLQLVEDGQEETGHAVLAWRLVAVAIEFCAEARIKAADPPRDRLV